MTFQNNQEKFTQHSKKEDFVGKIQQKQHKKETNSQILQILKIPGIE